MGLSYMGKLGLSILFFAPGLILFTLFALVGLLMLGEKLRESIVRRRALMAAGIAPAQGAANPPPGEVVARLDEAIRTAIAGKEGKEEKEESADVHRIDERR